MIKVKAKIYLYKHKGRKTPFSDGYRPAFSFDNSNNLFTGRIELISQNEFERGTLGEVFITFIANNTTENLIKIGKTFGFNEPPNEIGEGEVLEIISDTR